MNTILDDVNDISDHDIDGSLRSEWVPLNAQQAVNQEAEAWANVWQQGVQGNMPRWPLQLGDRLPDLAVDTFREACYTFSNGVGLGWDKLHPRAIARCSDVVINALLQLFALAEASGKWQETIGIILVVLIPKSDGGRRPIGLFPTLIRVWMRARLPVARLWMLQNDRSFFYAGPCKGADVAAWKQNLLGEAAHFMELPYVSSLLDLVKAFDSVPFDCLVECATRLGYNLYLLRLSIASYLLARVLNVEGCCSVEVFATRGLAAGSVLATIELRILLLEAGDRMVSIGLYSRITLYVDDATFETVH